MYFHSSNSRRDHYATLRTQHQLFKQQQIQQQPRSVTSISTISGTDSGYQSPPSSPLSHHIEKDKHQYGTKQDQHDNASTTCSFVTDSTTSTKKKKRTTKKHLDYPSRQPDLVYSSPRPLAFPFHNDCHFLPVAEADPRDIARITPPPPSRHNSTSSKTASITSSSYPRTSISSIPEDDTISHTTNDSRPASLISSVQHGTVRSLRSFFQMNGQPQQQPTHRPVTPDHRLLALEPKTGTVASLRKLFSRPPTTKTHHADLEAETAIHTAKNSQSGNRTKTLFFGKRRSMTDPPQQQQQQQRNSHPSNRFTLSHLWPSKTASEILDDLPKPPSTLPGPKKRQQPSPTPSFSTGLKNFFTRPTPLTKNSSPTIETATATDPPSSTILPPPHKPFFASFRRTARKDMEPQTPKKQHTTISINDTLASPPPAQPSTAVGRIWKNFKRLVNGNKVSRIGVL